MKNPVIFCHGLGCDSTAALVEILKDPNRFDIDLDHLIVLTAQTGDEHPLTKQMTELFLYPKLRSAGVRTVQVARAGLSEKERVRVLDDTRSPVICHTEGAYKLSDLCLQTGSVPQFSGARLCSQRFKKWVMDTWLKVEFGGQSLTVLINFNADEQKRVTKAEKHYVSGRETRFIPMEQGWTRSDTEIMASDLAGGEPWPRSACTYCPFAVSSGTRNAVLQKYRVDPRLALLGLRIEFNAMSLNPRQSLYKDISLMELLVDDNNQAAIDLFHANISERDWGVYEVRRLYPHKKRSLKLLEVGPRTSMESMVLGLAERYQLPLTQQANGSTQAWHIQRSLSMSAKIPGKEHLVTAIPADPIPNQPSWFDRAWPLLG